jgi:hypothetical protein
LFAGCVTHIFGKLLMRNTTLLYTSPQLEVYTKNYRFPKSWESQFQKFQDIQLGSLGTKWHLDVAFVVNHKEYYKREGGGFPQVGVVMSLVNQCVSVVCVHAPKVFQLCINKLIVWFVQVCVNNWPTCNSF